MALHKHSDILESTSSRICKNKNMDKEYNSAEKINSPQ